MLCAPDCVVIQLPVPGYTSAVRKRGEDIIYVGCIGFFKYNVWLSLEQALHAVSL